MAPDVPLITTGCQVLGETMGISSQRGESLVIWEQTLSSTARQYPDFIHRGNLQVPSPEASQVGILTVGIAAMTCPHRPGGALLCKYQHQERKARGRDGWILGKLLGHWD